MSTVSDEIKPLLTSLSGLAKLAFAYSVCVRMQPNYHDFYKAEGWGSPEVLEKGISSIRAKVLGQTFDSNVKNLLSEVESISPDTEDFSGSLTSYALDATCAIYAALEFLVVQDDERIIEVATLGRDTVDMFVQEINDLSPNDPELERKIAQDPFMLIEVQRQQTALQRLSQINHFTSNVLDDLVGGKMIDTRLLVG